MLKKLVQVISLVVVSFLVGVSAPLSNTDPPKGLETNLQFGSWFDGKGYLIYSLRRTESLWAENLWIINKVEGINVYFYDKAGKLIKESYENVIIGDDFSSGKTDRVNVDVLLLISEKGKFVSIEFRASGLVTKKVQIPEKKPVK